MILVSIILSAIISKISRVKYLYVGMVNLVLNGHGFSKDVPTALGSSLPNGIASAMVAK
jgi:hypothetical protein